MRLLCVLLLVLGLSACSLEKDSGSAAPDRPRASESTPDPESAQPDASDTPACAEVRAGIDAFNTSEFANTVDHFRRALPLARAQAGTKPSKAADDLVEAVEYYARLAPEDYPRSAASSAEFAKYKAITLGQCVVGQEPSQPEPSKSPGVPA
jgi:hypothetical protein